VSLVQTNKSGIRKKRRWGDGAGGSEGREERVGVKGDML